jgi:hypothetical protein
LPGVVVDAADLRPVPLPWFSLRRDKKLNQEGQDTAE